MKFDKFSWAFEIVPKSKEPLQIRSCVGYSDQMLCVVKTCTRCHTYELNWLVK